jgi:NAD(P)-dependent dehydrogenase (short-subunit alcohol dehydrogenase family)
MGQSMYSASKFALESLSEALAIEVREFGIRVAIVEPGIFKTEIVSRAAATQVDEQSPYANTERRIAAIYANGSATGGEPQTVAEVIEQAVSTGTPRLRYAVGIDAPVFLAGRKAITDEEWVDFGAPMSDEEYWTLFAKTFPMPSP